MAMVHDGAARANGQDCDDGRVGKLKIAEKNIMRSEGHYGIQGCKECQCRGTKSKLLSACKSLGDLQDF